LAIDTGISRRKRKEEAMNRTSSGTNTRISEATNLVNYSGVIIYGYQLNDIPYSIVCTYIVAYTDVNSCASIAARGSAG
jgi:hypothetical protein